MTHLHLLLLFAIVALTPLAGCASAPARQPSGQAQPPKAGCHVGADAGGVAAGFFALFQDRPECF